MWVIRFRLSGSNNGTHHLLRIRVLAQSRSPSPGQCDENILRGVQRLYGTHHDQFHSSVQTLTVVASYRLRIFHATLRRLQSKMYEFCNSDLPKDSSRTFAQLHDVERSRYNHQESEFHPGVHSLPYS